MTFVSYQFLLFFPIVTALYFALPPRFRWQLLLLASCIFYAAFIPAYLLILFVLIGIDYYAGLSIERSAGRARRVWLLASILSTCAALFSFKYFDFFATNADALAAFFNIPASVPLMHLILPIGLSFHTFQSLAYVFEVYKGRTKAERHLGIYALYVMFYPQLVAGPIERPQNLLHQFRETHQYDPGALSDGIKRMSVGLLKKTVIADNLAIFVNRVYAAPHEFDGMALLAATLFFTIQIYCDFSGYSDIAIGSARTMGFTLMENFKQPYFASSLGEFWNRWHRSLSTWFRDYVYIPLGGNRVTFRRWAFNILVTFTVSGIWHGANWTYIVWGALHGGYLVLERAFETSLSPVLVSSRHLINSILALGHRLATLFIVILSWAFFRADTISHAFFIIERSIRGTATILVASFAAGGAAAAAKAAYGSLLAPLLLLNLGRKELVLFAAVLMLWFAIDWIDSRRGIVAWMNGLPAAVRWPLYAAILLAVINLGATNEVPFIYFQF